MNAKQNVIDLASRTVVTVTDAQKENLPCGAIVFWELSGDTTVEKITNALTAFCSSAKAPEAPSVKVAATRACHTVAERHKLRVQPITKAGAGGTQTKGRTRATGGIALSRPLAVRADGNLGRLDGPIVALYRAPEIRTREIAQPDGSTKLEHYSVPASFDGEPAMVEELRAELARALEVLTPTDVSSWLCDRVTSLGGFPLKSNGGTYFVPPEAMSRYGTLRAAVQAVTQHRMARIPAMKGSEAVEAVLMALETNTTNAIESISLAIASGELGSKALKTKEQELSGLLARLGKYETLLGKKLDTVRVKIEEATSAAAVAMLAASANNEE